MKKSMMILYNYVIKTLNNQDFQQKTNMVISVSLELYRVMISSLLIIFVPQKCDDHVCSLMDNLYADNKLYYIGLIINYITLVSFLMMYICETRREEKLIKILEVNKTISTDNESVGKRLDILPKEKHQQILNVDKHYQYISYYVMCVYGLNITFSSIVINEYSLGNQTLVIFLTNLLFMITKLSNVYNIINTEQNIFFSAYLNTKVQFNDLDPRELGKIQKQKSIDERILQIIEKNDLNLMEENKLKILDKDGFKIIVSSDSSDSDDEETVAITVTTK
jgi:hypothetical protein